MGRLLKRARLTLWPGLTTYILRFLAVLVLVGEWVSTVSMEKTGILALLVLLDFRELMARLEPMALLVLQFF